MRLYHLLLEQCKPQHRELNEKVWKPTPWIINVYTGLSEDNWPDMREWLINNIGAESEPIFGRTGNWHRGSATVDGWTWIGFSDEILMISFMNNFPSLSTLNPPERHNDDTDHPSRD